MRDHIEGSVEFVVAVHYLHLLPLAEAVEVVLAAIKTACRLLDFESSCSVECVGSFLVPGGVDVEEEVPDAARVAHYQQPDRPG